MPEEGRILAATELMLKGERPYLAGFAVPQRVRGIPDFVLARRGLRRAYCLASAFITTVAPNAVNALVASARSVASACDDFRFVKGEHVLAYILIAGMRSATELSTLFSLKFGVNTAVAQKYITELTQKGDKEHS